MPGTVKVRVLSARDLPIMDRTSELTDAFVELRLGESYQRTRVCPKTLNPTWNTGWFTFTVSDEELQDEPLQIKLLDKDMYTANDAIGKVYIRLDSLIGGVAGGVARGVDTLDGWFPIFDTLHGIRGEVRVMVRVEVVADQHPLKQSSHGVAIFTCPCVPVGYSVASLHGFVEELVVNDDPEYQWIDKIRTPRASNEARQRLFSRLSGELQRKVGVKTLEVGGNAVIGYRQRFDLEGESGIVVRGIGTCVRLVTGPSPAVPVALSVLEDSSPHHHREESPLGSDPPPSPTKNITLAQLGDPVTGVSAGSGELHPSLLPRSSSEFPFYTLSTVPDGVGVSLGGVVSAHSVKLLDRINNPDEPVTRDGWWVELRNEIRQHCRAMGCNAVIAYSESTSICDNLCVFSACGTAARLSTPTPPTSPGVTSEGVSESVRKCGPCHAPYTALPFSGSLTQCGLCQLRNVPSVLVSTSELPEGLCVRGRGGLVQVSAMRDKKKLKGDDNARQVGQELPFLEVSLHEKLLSKLRLRGMNAVFKYRLLLNVGDSVIMGTVFGTGVCVSALPPPPRPLVTGVEPSKSDQYQSLLSRTGDHLRRHYLLDQHTEVSPRSVSVEVVEGASAVVVPLLPDSTVKREHLSNLVSDRPPPAGYHLSSTIEVPGLSLKPYDTRTVTMVTKVVSDTGRRDVSVLFERLLQGLMFRVREMRPCALTNLTYDIDLPEDNEIQVAVTAAVSRLGDPLNTTTSSDDLLFTMDTGTESTSTPSEEACVHTSSLPSLPGYKVTKYLGIINLFLIRESTSVGEHTRANSFLHVFILEALSVARAHVAALGGNALLSYRLSEVVFIEHPQKRQAQCLLNLSGDAAVVLPVRPHTTGQGTAMNSV